jgi:hypothetical protein
MPEGELAPPLFPREAHPDRALIWLASYPKSGNTWTRILFANFFLAGEQAGNADERAKPESEGGIPLAGTISSDRPNFDDATGLPSSDLTPTEIDLLRPGAYRQLATRAQNGQIFIKTHDAYQVNAEGAGIFPADCTRGAVLLVRHPMDVALSYGYHMGHADSARAVRSLANPNHVMAGDGKRQIHQRTMGWHGHYLSWTRQDAIPLLVVRYEDMLADTTTQFLRMLRFLEIPGADDSARVQRAVALSRFERLQSIEERDGFREIPVRAERFFRSGRAGEGIAQLPDDLKRLIMRKHRAVMAELGYSQDGTDPL